MSWLIGGMKIVSWSACALHKGTELHQFFGSDRPGLENTRTFKDRTNTVGRMYTCEGP